MPVKTTTGTSAIAGSACIRLEQLEAGHVGQAQVEHDAIERPVPHRGQRGFAAVDRHDFDVVVIQQLDDRVSLDVVVFDDQQAPCVRGA